MNMRAMQQCSCSENKKTIIMNPKFKQVLELLKEIGKEEEAEQSQDSQFFFVVQDLNNGDIEISCAGAHELLVEMFLSVKDGDEKFEALLRCVENGGCARSADLLNLLTKKPTAQA